LFELVVERPIEKAVDYIRQWTISGSGPFPSNMQNYTRQWTISALLLAFVVALVKANNGTYQVPMQLVTETHIFGDAYEVHHFSAHLCGGCLFDKQTAIVSLNLQKQPWNNTIQDILKATVTDPHGTTIKTNSLPTGFVSTFKFPYHKSYGDLYIKIENGAGSGMIYTLSLKFEKGKEATDSDCESRWAMNFLETHAHWKHRTAVTAVGEQLHELVPIFRLSEPYTVKTSDLKYLQLDYCFPNVKGKYHLSVSVIANDQQSSFATYACPSGIPDCEPGNAPFHDTSGSAANFVQVAVSGAAEIGPVTVVVRGDGRYKEMNTFSLAASKYTEE